MNFSKGEKNLFIEHIRICVVVTEIKAGLVSLFDICHLCMAMKLFKTKILKNKRLRLIYCFFLYYEILT